jgi:hypothetical protein
LERNVLVGGAACMFYRDQLERINDPDFRVRVSPFPFPFSIPLCLLSSALRTEQFGNLAMPSSLAPKATAFRRSLGTQLDPREIPFCAN